MLLAALLVVVYAIAMLLTDPRIAIAGTIPLAMLGVGATGKGADWAAVLLIATLPAVLLIATERNRRLARATSSGRSDRIPPTVARSTVVRTREHARVGRQRRDPDHAAEEQQVAESEHDHARLAVRAAGC